MKNTELKWTDREICEVYDGKIITYHASIEAALRDKTPETTIIVCSKEEALKMPLFELSDEEEVYYE